MRLAVTPGEANPPLIIDPNAVLSSPISLECFEMVARRNTQILQLRGGIQVEQLAPRHSFDCLKPEHRPILEQRLSVAASKRSDQGPLYDAPGIPSTRMVFCAPAPPQYSSFSANWITRGWLAIELTVPN